MKPDLAQNRKVIQGWEFVESIIYGNHRWNFYKFKVNKEQDPFEKLEQYFDKKEITKYKKELKELFLNFEDIKWIPENRLYLKLNHGFYDNMMNVRNHRIIDVGDNRGKPKFKEINQLRPIEFIEFVLWVADWESITSIQDIVNNFFTLFEKFKIFVTNNLLPNELKDKFNETISSIKGCNIKPIVNLNYNSFYKFVMQCPNNQMESFLKLLELIKASDFLQGQGTFQNWQPSFDKFVNKLDEIFEQKYNTKINLARFKKLTETEYIIEGKIYSDTLISDEIKEKYRLDEIAWPIKKKKELPWNEEDLKLEEKYFIKKKNILQEIKKQV